MAARIEFRRDNDWGLGFVGRVTLLPDAPVSGWTLVFEASFEINNIWGADIIAHTPGRYLLRSAPWNGSIAAGGSATIGFTASPGGAVADPLGWTLGPVDGGFPPPPPPSISVSDALAIEGGSAVFEVTLSAAATTAVTVRYTTANATARAGQDFVAASGTITFAPGETRRQIAIALLDDAVIEASEQFSLKLVGATGATLGDALGLATITDDDAPRITVSDAVVTERHSGVASLNFTVTLSHAVTVGVGVGFATADGTALAGQDYTARTGTLTFAPGQTSKTVTVSVTGDRVVEANETLALRLSNPVRGVIADGEGIGTIRNDDLPSISIADAATTTETDPGDAPLTGVLSTRGNQIIDATGSAVKIAAVNWFGLETTSFAPHGLQARNWHDMMDQMAGLGFNTIRLPFSAQAVLEGGTPSGIDFALNPDLAGLTPLQIIDRIVDYAGDIGLRIILDHHRSTAGDGPNASGLWHEGAYTTLRWVQMWEMLAQRYRGDPTVIGADLHNEPHAANWKNWANAAEVAGNAILAKNPDWLILVEGVGQYGGDYYWWGGQLEGAADRPVVLNTPGKLVYAPHDYPNSVYPQPFFHTPDFPANLPGLFDRMWGYLWREGTAPVLLGEFGSRLEQPLDRAWMEKITAYLSGDTDANGVKDVAGPGASFAWWAWNPDSGDTGGILADDWKTVVPAKLAALQPLLPDPPAPPRHADFVVSLNTAAFTPVSVQWRTVAGTADATDYVAAQGTLVFAPGETRKVLSVLLRADEVPEATEAFRIELSAPVGATFADAVGVARILDDDWIL